MNESEVIMESAATFTYKDVELYERATAAGIPTVIVSMYKTALQKLIADEREECAKVCKGLKSPLKEADRYFNNGCNASAAAIRARGEK